MLKPDRFSCSQKIRLKQDPPVYGDYRRNRLQLKEAAIPTTVLVSTTITTSTTVQPTSIPLYTKDVLTKHLCCIKELPIDNNGIQISH